VIDDTRLFTEKLQEWEDYYNCHRAHGASAAKPPTNACGRKPKTRCHRPPSVAHLAAEPRRCWLLTPECMGQRRGVADRCRWTTAPGRPEDDCHWAVSANRRSTP
jgi:hypothetical protein